ncbi:MAG: hypothetical protein NTV65_00735 [Proteobacteria bacterium]|nr:hypothetical protein [Pseudomonadota bacterium]
MEDRNKDGVIEVLAFGYSITYWVGDGIAPGTYVEGPLAHGATQDGDGHLDSSAF